MLQDKYKLIAVCTAGIDSEYNDLLMGALYERADSFGVKLLYFNCFSNLYEKEKHDAGEKNIFHLMNYEMLDGIILLTDTIKDEATRMEIVQRAQTYEIPVVSIDSYVEGCYNVNFRYHTAIEDLITHLIEKHHYTKINFIAGLKGNSFSEERLDVYKRVLAAHNIPLEEGRIGYGDFWGGPTKQVVQDFLDSDLPMPEAIVCANDTMAIAAFKYLVEAGYRIPEDIAITGFDGIREAMEHSPSITTAKHDYPTAATRALEILDRHFRGEKQEKQCSVDSKIIYGGSCGCAQEKTGRYSTLVRELYERIDFYDYFIRMQVAMTANLADNDSFYGVFDNLKNYVENFMADKFWVCIADDFLTEKESLSDIIEEQNMTRVAYSGTMDIMLSYSDGEWQGMTDFSTNQLLPHIERVFETENNIMFLPLHVLERSIGYVALVYNPEKMKLQHVYSFFMNVSNALEVTRMHQRQQSIINSLENKYVHDPMTGLFNRRGFYQRLLPIYQKCTEDGSRMMVVSVDLNGLKFINDTYGHADGDIAISTVGKALSHAAPAECTCARFGGDEYVVAGVATEEEMEQFHQQVEEYLEQFNAGSGKPYSVSASIGCLSVVPNTSITLDECIKVADERMYEEKARHHACRA